MTGSTARLLIAGALAWLASGCERGAVSVDGGRFDMYVDDMGRDASPADGKARPVVDVARLDSGSSALQVAILKATAWANLMPEVKPDPTHATMTVRYTNGGTAALGGIQLRDPALVGASGTPVHPLEMKSTGLFGGQLQAGASATVDYYNIPSATKTPVPVKCGAPIKLRTRASFTGGVTGSVESSTVLFACGY